MILARVERLKKAWHMRVHGGIIFHRGVRVRSKLKLSGRFESSLRKSIRNSEKTIVAASCFDSIFKAVVGGATAYQA